MGKERLSFRNLALLEEFGLEAGDVVTDCRIVAGLLSNCGNNGDAERLVRYNMNRETCVLIIRRNQNGITKQFVVLTECVERLYHLDYLNEDLPDEGCHIVTLSKAGEKAVADEWFFGIPSFLFKKL